MLSVIVFLYYFEITERHALATGQPRGLELQDAGLGGRESDSLPDGIVDDIGELAAGNDGPVGPVGRYGELIVGHGAVALGLRRQIAESGQSLV